jgi:hypothetical protein
MASFLSHPSDKEAARLKPNFGRITIGRRATISHGAHLCAAAHDHTKSDFPLLHPPIMPGSAAVDWNTVIFSAFTIKGIYGREMYETWYKMTAMIRAALISHRSSRIAFLTHNSRKQSS